MAVKPGEFAESAHRGHRQAGAFGKGVVAQLARELSNLFGTAAIVPGDRGGSRPPVGAEQNHGFSHARDAHCDDSSLRCRVKRRFHGLQRGVEQVGWVDLGAGGNWPPGVGALPRETSVPSRPITAALVMVVPTSIPTSNSGATLDIFDETCKVAKGLRTGEECMSFTNDGEAPGSEAAEAAPPPVIAVRGIAKHFGSIQALRSVDLDVHKGEVVGLIGDNGAGKSTLVNILSGALQPNAGTILLDGKPVTFASSLEARRAGIETVYQDLSLAPDLNVWQNIFLGREKTVKGPLRLMGWLDRRSMAREAEADLERTHIRIGSVTLSGRAALRGPAPGDRSRTGGFLGVAGAPHGRAHRRPRSRAARDGGRAGPFGVRKWRARPPHHPQPAPGAQAG